MNPPQNETSPALRLSGVLAPINTPESVSARYSGARESDVAGIGHVKFIGTHKEYDRVDADTVDQT